MKLIETDRNFKIFHDDKNGIEIISPSNRSYAILELVSFRGTANADTLVIFETNENGYKRLVNFTFGADDAGLENCIDIILDYEAGNKQTLDDDLQED